MRKFIAPVFAVIVALGLAGCQASVSASDVEEQIKQQLASYPELAPDEVSCPDSLPAEVGAEMTCTATKDGEETKYKVVVTSVENNTVNFNIEPA
ncbi:DUF4333 domain-containing protein [Enemella sp. A6]|uniref:DUF4333 domain-containing protein n=1 Tax=Enemella sp. A6 TaxID=3440152 RepID=UPI003EBB9A0A